MHLDSPVWRGLFNGCFGIASLLLAVFFGAALGNVVRGVPLQPDGYFFLPLWTDWTVGPQPGILDWYTVLAGVVALVALALHGANYAALKTGGDLNRRCRAAAALLLARAARAYSGEPGGDARHSPQPAGQLSAHAGAVRDSGAGGGIALRHVEPGPRAATSAAHFWPHARIWC